MTGISAVIITLNEEQNIGDCIDSLMDVADEIIVVDSWSSDHTPAICKEKGVRFYQYTWEGYGGTKNYANSLATFPLILSVDADEVVSKELKESIILVKSNPQHDFYKLNRRTNYCGHWMMHLWYPDAKIRLFFKDKAAWDDATVHEELRVSPGGKVGYLKGDLYHYTCRSITQHMRTVHKYTSLKAIQANSVGKKASLVKIIVGPISKFFSEYLLKKGFLDGYYGFIACCISAIGSFIQYVKLHELNNGKPI
ncbi:MAG: glycosyltransferase family 2 protein [Bacteroidota bacterium]|nr:glycosyltransferase family 2 protein [Bacteroidota bacterium]